MPQYKTDIFRYALDVATQNKREDISGNALMIVRASSEASLINIEVKGKNLQGSGSLPFQNRDELELPEIFDQMLLSWEAQPGQWIEILVITLDPAPEVFNYTRQERGTIDSIASTVSVREEPSASFATNQVNIGVAGGLIVAQNLDRKEVAITNRSISASLFIRATAGVANGHMIPPYATLVLPSTSDVYGYSTETIPVSYLEN